MLQERRIEEVVPIQEEYPCAGCGIEAPVSRLGDAAVSLVNGAEAAVGLYILVYKAGAFIRAAVVDADALPRWVALRFDRGERCPQEGGDVVDGDNEGKAWHGWDLLRAFG